MYIKKKQISIYICLCCNLWFRVIHEVRRIWLWKDLLTWQNCVVVVVSLW